MTTEYHYGGKGDPLKQRRKLRIVTCATLAVMVLSQMTSAFAWGHHRHYFYRMPDGTVWSTRHRYGWGDWDDFAMYSGRFGIIPVRSSGPHVTKRCSKYRGSDPGIGGIP